MSDCLIRVKVLIIFMLTLIAVSDFNTPLSIAMPFSVKALFRCQLKHKILREAFNVSFYLFIQSFGFHSIQQCQVPVNHHLPTPDVENSLLNLRLVHFDLMSGNLSNASQFHINDI